MSRHNSKICFAALFVLGFTSFSVNARQCNLHDFLHVLGNPKNSMLFESEYTPHYVRFLIGYDASKNILIGRYAQGNPEKSVEMISPVMKDGVIRFRALNSLDSPVRIDLKFRDVNEKVYTSNDSCDTLDGVIYFSKTITRKIMFSVNGPAIFRPEYRDAQIKNQKAAIKLKEIAATNSKFEFMKLLSYPFNFCKAYPRGFWVIINTPKEAESFYSKIMTSGERKIIKNAVPYNLYTGSDSSSLFARQSISIHDGHIITICVQSDPVYLMNIVPCYGCP